MIQLNSLSRWTVNERPPCALMAQIGHKLLQPHTPDFDALHCCSADEEVVALAFDPLFSGDDIPRQPLIERKKVLQWVLVRPARGVQYWFVISIDVLTTEEPAEE